jgi:four helix bundle protein
MRVDENAYFRERSDELLGKTRGILDALPKCMPGVTRFTDLECHKLAVAIRREVLRLTRREVVRRDFRFLHQIRDSARSAPRNIAEGYSRFNPSEIIPFLNYAKSSLDETRNHVVDGQESGYFTDEEAQSLLSLVNRAIAAIVRWMQYLESPAARAFYERHRARRRGIDPPRSSNRRTRNPKNPEP